MPWPSRQPLSGTFAAGVRGQWLGSPGWYWTHRIPMSGARLCCGSARRAEQTSRGSSPYGSSNQLQADTFSMAIEELRTAKDTYGKAVTSTSRLSPRTTLAVKLAAPRGYPTADEARNHWPEKNRWNQVDSMAGNSQLAAWAPPPEKRSWTWRSRCKTTTMSTPYHQSARGW